MDPLQTKVLVELEDRLQDALEAARSRQNDMMARLDDARDVIEKLLRNEAQETALYVENVRLQMRAIRDVLQLEIESARREVRLSIEEAKLNITHARRQRDQRREELNAKMAKLQEWKQAREQQRAQEIERVREEAAKAAARLVQQVPMDDGTATRLESVARSHPTVNATLATPISPKAVDVRHSSMSSGEEPVWALPLALTLVLGACLWAIYARYRMKRAAVERRVLYSDQLRNHFAKAVPAQKAVETEKENVTREEERAPEGTRPVLRRRLRPGWSPSASTASTVSVVDAAAP